MNIEYYKLLKTLRGANHPELIPPLQLMATIYDNLVNPREAIVLYKRALLILASVKDPDPQLKGELFGDLGASLRKIGDLKNAKVALEFSAQTFRDRSQLLSQSSLYALDELANVLMEEQSFSQAGVIYDEVINAAQRAGEMKIKRGWLLKKCVLLEAQGEVERSKILLDQLLNDSLRDQDKDPLAVANILKEAAFLYVGFGEHRKSRDAAERSLAIIRKHSDGKPMHIATSMITMAYAVGMMSDYQQAYQIAQEAEELINRAPPSSYNQQLYAKVLQFSASFDVFFRALDSAEVKIKKAISILNKGGLSRSRDMAEVLVVLAFLHRQRGHLKEAESIYKEIIALLESNYGPESGVLSSYFRQISEIQQDMGQYIEANSYLKKNLAVSKAVYGDQHYKTSKAYESLAYLHIQMGDYKKGDELSKQALMIMAKAKGKLDPEYAMLLRQSAIIAQRRGRDQEALDQLDEAANIYRRLSGSKAVLLSHVIADQAKIEMKRGRLKKADALLKRARKSYAKIMGRDTPRNARMIKLQGMLALMQNKTGLALERLHETLEYQQGMFGEDSLVVAELMHLISAAYEARGEHIQSVQYKVKANDILERSAVEILSTGSVRRKHAFMRSYHRDTDNAISLHFKVGSADREATHMALTALLRGKGRVLDAVTDSLANLRRSDPEAMGLIARLTALRAQLSTAAMDTQSGCAQREVGQASHTRGFKQSKGLSLCASQTPEQKTRELAQLKARMETLEEEISERSAALHTLSRPVTVEHVARELPKNSVLLEFVVYQPRDLSAYNTPGEYGAERYAVYLLFPDGTTRAVSLGAKAEIDQAIFRVRDEVIESPCAVSRCTPDQMEASLTELKRVARELDRLTLAKLRPLLVGDERWLVAPDGAFNLIPLEIFVDERGRYLIESTELSYLTSGRDLMRPKTTRAKRDPSTVIADPDYDLTADGERGSAPVHGGGAQRAASLSGVQWPRLPGTRREAQAIAPILEGSKVLMGAAAQESAIKALKAPAVLHVATHGFFIDEDPQGGGEGTRGFKQTPSLHLERDPPQIPANPLLRSGIVLAGVNQNGGAQEDGILTALEVAGLDLWGTEMVTLSACETGIGKVERGEGVFGLRRSLVLAGAHSQVMSLWKVSDEATSLLMTQFYKEIAVGRGRAEAIQASKKTLLASPEWRHPFFWAAFIQSGDWRPLNKTLYDSETASDLDAQPEDSSAFDDPALAGDLKVDPSEKTGGFIVSPHVSMILLGSGALNSTCTSSDPILCPAQREITVEDFSLPGIGVDLLYDFGLIRAGVGSLFVLSTEFESPKRETLGQDLSIEGIVELNLEFTSWLGLSFRAQGGMFRLQPDGDLQGGIDRMESQCEAFVERGLSCEVTAGPFVGTTVGAGIGLSLNLPFVTLKPEIRYQMITVDLQNFEAGAEGGDQVTTKADYQGDRLWLSLGLEWGR